MIFCAFESFTSWSRIILRACASRSMRSIQLRPSRLPTLMRVASDFYMLKEVGSIKNQLKRPPGLFSIRLIAYQAFVVFYFDVQFRKRRRKLIRRKSVATLRIISSGVVFLDALEE